MHDECRFPAIRLNECVCKGSTIVRMHVTDHFRVDWLKMCAFLDFLVHAAQWTVGAHSVLHAQLDGCSDGVSEHALLCNTS
jgi:hypothetical protein